MSIFEILMLVCFGLSWPMSIYKSLKTKVVAGKSPLFLGIIILGYSSGIVHKIVYDADWVIALYIINFLLAFVDMGVYFYYTKGLRQKARMTVA